MAIAELITNRAAGNPFYCERLMFAGVYGVVRVDQGECFASHGLTADFPVLPQSVKSVVVTRFDALPLESQLLLKVASALSGTFSLDLLQDIHPNAATIEGVEEMLDSLVAKKHAQARHFEPGQNI